MKKNKINIVLLIIMILSFSFNTIYINADVYKNNDYVFSMDEDEENSGNENVKDISKVKDDKNIVKNDNSDKKRTIIIVAIIIVGIQIVFLIIYHILIKIGLISGKNERNRERVKKKILETQNKIFNEIPNFDFERFYDQVFTIFNEVEEARSNFEYENLRKLVSLELYDKYYSELSSYEKDNKKYNMKDCILEDIYLTDFTKDEKEYTIKLVMKTSQYESVVNGKGNVISGSQDKRVNRRYNIILTKPINDNNMLCPKCGSPILDGVSNICPFCNNVILVKKYEWILSSIK